MYRYTNNNYRRKITQIDAFRTRGRKSGEANKSSPFSLLESAEIVIYT